MKLSRRRAISAREDTAFFQPALLSRQSGRNPIWQSADVGQTTFAASAFGESERLPVPSRGSSEFSTDYFVLDALRVFEKERVVAWRGIFRILPRRGHDRGADAFQFGM